MFAAVVFAHWRLLALTLLLVSAGQALAAKEALPQATFFAFDDHAIPLRDNLQLTLVPATKHEKNPVLRCGPPGSPDHGHAVLYGSVLWIEGKFRMWYLGMSQREIVKGQAPGWWRPMCYAESDDGIIWTKPELGLVDFNGGKKNNICLIESEPHSLSRVNDFLTVLHEPGDPDPKRRYKAVYIAHVPFEEVKGGRSVIGPNESRWGALICATSADGLTWNVVGDRPANAGRERFEVSGLYHFNGFYHATGQLLSPWTWLPDGRDVGRIMLTYRSPDFMNWTRAHALGFVRAGQTTSPPIPGQQTHMGAGFWNRGNVLVGFYGMWQDGPKERPKGSAHLWGMRMDLGLIVSNDGLHFREPVPDFKIIPRGDESKGEWDSLSLLQGHAFANVGEKTYVWYSHWDNESQFRTQEIGLATWRRDGFGYLGTKHKQAEGEFVTQTVEVGEKGLSFKVNVEGATEKHPLKIEVLDARDQPVANGSVLLSASGIDVPAFIPAGTLKPGSRVALRVTLPKEADVRVYAVYVEGAGGQSK